MKYATTKTTAIIGLAALVTLALAINVKSQPTSSDTDSYFTSDEAHLKAAPANLLILRPTHFSEDSAKIRHVHNGDALAVTMGRNVTFRDLMAEAYDCNPGHVVLPHDAPEGGFDFLVTVTPKTRHELRSLIEKTLDYTAKPEMRDTDVLRLTVKDPTLPGLVVDTNAESDISYRSGTIYFTHEPMSLVVKGLEDGFAQPVINQTGLKDSYDFSVTWNEQTTQAMRTGGFHLEGAQRVLNGWGLDLQPGRARMKMFIVTKLH